MIIIYIISLIAGFVLLVKGSDYFVDGSASVAAHMGIPQLIIGLTIVAMGTSAPEAAVSITAAFQGSADITIGNIVGSNILNIFIILGIASAIIPIAVAKSTIRYEIPYMIIITAVLLALGYDGMISFFDGIILWALFILYLTYLFISARKNKESNDAIKNVKGFLQAVYIIGGLAAILVGSKFAVYGATQIARLVGISERFIGLTIVALGTSLPELFTSVIAARKGNADIAIGNIVGSNIFNILFVVGTAALVSVVPFEPKFIIDTVVAITAGVILLLCVCFRKKLTRPAGIVMLTCYVAYLIYLCIM
ncbi:MAG: calcium/sodium antiporter [Lachnospira sp.]